MTESTFGAELRRLRRLREWTQEDLAEAAGIEQASVSQYERGKHIPSMEIIGRLARAFRIPVEEMARTAGHLPEVVTPRDAFDRAPIARLLSILEAMPGMSGQLDQLNGLATMRQEEVIRRLARRFAFDITEELLAIEDDRLARHSTN